MKVVRSVRSVVLFSCVLFVHACSSSDSTPERSEADAGTDVDATTAVCGDGVLSPAEACEGFELRAQRCTDLDFESGVLGCSATCEFDTSRCVRCGDGVVGGSEVCDGSVAADLTCASIRGEGATGTVSCAEDCTAVLDDACVDPAVDVPFAPCATSGPPCADGLVCAPTALGDLCVPPCSGNEDCEAEAWCSTVAPDISTCLPRPAEGQACEPGVPCVDSLSCVPAFLDGPNSVSVCARTCDACSTDERCVEVPAGLLELSSDEPCNPDLVTSCGEGFLCLDTDPGESAVFRCARVYSLCAVPQELYAFGPEGPRDEQICDLTGPTAGGRFCGPPSTSGSAVALCYPIFGEGESLGACIGLCDDGTTEGFGDSSCGEGWTCSVPSGAGLFYPQPGSRVTCTDDDRSACADGYTECQDLGGGLTCVRPARICTPAEGAP